MVRVIIPQIPLFVKCRYCKEYKTIKHMQFLYHPDSIKVHQHNKCASKYYNILDFWTSYE